MKTEEKGSDVNVATYLLLDAFQRDCDVAASSTRTRPRFEAVRFNRPSSKLRTPALGACQFPPVPTDTKGEIRKPARR